MFLIGSRIILTVIILGIAYFALQKVWTKKVDLLDLLKKPSEAIPTQEEKTRNTNTAELVNTTKNKPIKNFASRYTLAADMNILTDHVHVNGINVRGNVNVDNAEGIELKKMKIFNADEYSKGKINIDRSQEFSVKENVVENEINVNHSKSFDVTRNTVGENVDRDKQAQESINIILTDLSTSSEIMLNLAIIQKLIANDNILANALGNRIETLDKENKGYYKNVVLNHFKKLDAETIPKAEAKGVGMVFHWLNLFLHFNTK